jgi:hypothetical protein
MSRRARARQRATLRPSDLVEWWREGGGRYAHVQRLVARVIGVGAAGVTIQPLLPDLETKNPLGKPRRVAPVGLRRLEPRERRPKRTIG